MLRHNTLNQAVFRPAVQRANRTAGAGIAASFRWHGIPMFEVSRFMGHSKPSTTESVYAHLITDDHSAAMAALGAMAGPSPSDGTVIRLRRRG